MRLWGILLSSWGNLITVNLLYMSKFNHWIYAVLSMAVGWVLLSCEKPGRGDEGEVNAPEITGMYLYDYYGMQTGVWGTPNVRKHDGHPDINVRQSLVIFPNPNYGSLAVFVNADLKLTKKIWLVPATFSDDPVISAIEIDPNFILSGGFPIGNWQFDSNSLQLNLSAYPRGYYRIYCSVNGALLYENILLQ